MVAEPDEGAHDLVQPHDLPHAAQGLLLAQWRCQIERLTHADAFRHHLINEVINRFETERLQHALRLGGGGTNVTAGEICGH